MLKRITCSLLVGLFVLSGTANAQSTGDTIVVSTINYESGTRDTMITFPNDPNVSYEKIIMLYNMRCKDGLVSTGANRNLGCGEWDYSCNTYITDSNYVDSIIANHPDYTISSFSGSSFDYKSTPTYTYQRQIQKLVSIDSTVSESSYAFGNGMSSLPNVIETAKHAGRSQYLFTSSELTTAGLNSGTIDALALQVASLPNVAKMFRVRIKATTDSTLNSAEPHTAGFTEVYFKQTAFTSGLNRIQFYTPYTWNGTDNLIVEFSFTNKTTGAAMNFSGDATSANGISSAGDNFYHFDGSNHIDANNYRGVLGDTVRTVEAWIKTTQTNREIIGWGINASSKKYIVRLHSGGQVRVEVSGGATIGTTNVADGQWHHIAVVHTGANIGNVEFYVDGVLDAKSSTGNHPMNTTSSRLVQIGRSSNNSPFVGEIADVRVWSKTLTQTEINDWMHREVNNTHPSFSSLELYYPLNEGSGNTVSDESGNMRHATVQSHANWSILYGLDHFKNWVQNNNRPKTTFYQGSYITTVVNDTLFDSIPNFSNTVKQYQVYSKAGTIKSDSLGVVNQYNYWEAKNEYIYDENGLLIDSVLITPDGTINVGNLSYFARSPSKFEIMSFVTPYGINLDMGMTGETWAFDVTDYAPVLKGQRRMSLERGGQWQEDMDIKFLFIVGTPDREVKNIQQIWKVDQRNYSQINNDSYFEPRDVMIDANGSAFKIRSMITGHGQEGEFIPRNHELEVAGTTNQWQVWKECAYNPVYPQGGTWVYDRAGWCPGMATDLKEWDITSLVTPGQPTQIDYSMSTASGDSRYIVSHQLVTYGAPNHTLDVSVVEIINPTSRIEYQRVGSICTGPVVRIRNTGSTTLTSAEITYWLNSSSKPQTYTWNGSLDFMEDEEVSLPVGALWDDLNGTSEVLHVEVDMPNGGADDYAYNNKMTSSFSIPDVMPNSILVRFRTNNVPQQNRIEVRDDMDNVVYSTSYFLSNSFHYDTLNLADGCYTFIMYDTGNNGFSWWAAPNDGNGQLQFRRGSTGALIRNFNGDFGAEIRYHFTVNAPLSFEELNPTLKTKVYPNPAKDRVAIELEDADAATVTLYSNTGQLMIVPTQRLENTVQLNTSSLSSGVYYIQLEVDEIIEHHKVVIL